MLPMAVLAAPQKKTPFTQTEVDTWVNFGTALTDGTNLLIMGATGSAAVTASDARVAGNETILASAVWDMNELGPMWGSFHLSNTGGTWDGYVQGANSLENGHVVLSLVATAVGGGGLVLRSTGTEVDHGNIHWTGYIVRRIG